ncbi:MAG: hypothetical protein ABI887_11155 [Burkholderiales bacterium]
MTTQSLSSVASNIVGQYSQASKHLVDAYRSGAQRLVIGANTQYVTLLNSGALPLVTEDVKARIFKVQTQITGLVEQGINGGSDRAEQAIDFVAGGVNGGIERVAAAAGRVEEALKTTALTKVGQVAILPVAQVSLTLVTRAAEGTKRLSERVAGTEVAAAPVVAKAKRVVKKAVRRVKARA